jgi:hypothetical protein
VEFFRIINSSASEESLQRSLDFNNLGSITNEIFLIGEENGTEAEIGGIWGEFTLIKTEIRGGLRFALKECPNALAWTITCGFPPAPEAVVVHLTINRQEKDPEFLEEIEEFLDDHCSCLQEFLGSLQEIHR